MSYPVLPEDRRYFEIGVEKADWTWRHGARDGKRQPGRRGSAPPSGPRCRRLEVTCAIGGRRRSELLARTPSASGSGGIPETSDRTPACASAANAAGSRGLSVTVQRQRRRSSARARPGWPRGERGPGGRAASRARLRRRRRCDVVAAPNAVAPARTTAEPEHAQRRRSAADHTTLRYTFHLRVLTGAPRVGRGNAPPGLFSAVACVSARVSWAFAESLFLRCRHPRWRALRHSARQSAETRTPKQCPRDPTTRLWGQRTTRVPVRWPP